MSFRIAFMGTPEFAVPSLEALVEAGHEVVGVFTQPDRPAGRGNKLTACPVKLCAMKHGLSVFQFERVSREEGLEAMRSIAPDYIVTAAFGQILKQALLDIPKYGTVNVHASLLPKHRGSAPINWCLLNGDAETGITTMMTDAGIDTGDMLLQVKTPIGEEETAGELTERLSRLGAELLIRTLDGLAEGSVKPVPQDHEHFTYDPMLKKEMGEIDWTLSAKAICDRVRGLNPWPCAATAFNGGALKLYRARPVCRESDAPAGTVVAASAKEGLIVRAGEGCVEILEMQAPGGKRMAAKAYLAGKPIPVGTKLG